MKKENNDKKRFFAYLKPTLAKSITSIIFAALWWLFRFTGARSYFKTVDCIRDIHCEPALHIMPYGCACPTVDMLFSDVISLIVIPFVLTYTLYSIISWLYNKDKKMLYSSFAGVSFGIVILVLMFLMSSLIDYNENEVFFNLYYYTLGFPYILGLEIMNIFGFYTSPYVLHATGVALLIYGLLGSMLYYAYSKFKKRK